MLLVCKLKEIKNQCSNCEAWSILKKLSGMSRHSPFHFPVSADAIASQLIRNERYEADDHDLWKATPPNPVDISDTFLHKQFTTAL